MLKQIVSLAIDAVDAFQKGDYTRAVADALKILTIIVSSLDTDQKAGVMATFPGLEELTK